MSYSYSCKTTSPHITLPKYIKINNVISYHLISFSMSSHCLHISCRVIKEAFITRFSNCLCNCYMHFPLSLCGLWKIYSAILPLRYPQEKLLCVCVTRRNQFQSSLSHHLQKVYYMALRVCYKYNMAISSRSNRIPACYIYIRNERANVCECYIWLLFSKQINIEILSERDVYVNLTYLENLERLSEMMNVSVDLHRTLLLFSKFILKLLS
jgi:hypothetical protein